MNRLISTALLLVAVAVPPALAQTEAKSSRNDLLRLVPDNVGVCFVISDLKSASPKVVQSKWFNKLKRTTLVAALLKSPEAAKLLQFGKDIEQLLGAPWARIRDDVLGDQLIYAYFPGADSSADESGLVLVRARDAALLRQLIDRINQKQMESGELKQLATMKHQGVEFTRRIERNGSHFYWIDGPTIAVTSHESVLREVIARSRASSAPAIALQKHFVKAGAADSTLRVFFNPRVLEQEFNNKLGNLSGPEKLALQSIHRYLSALQAIVVSADVSDGVELRISISVDPDELPASAKRFFTKPTQPSAVWTRFPKDAMLAVAGRVYIAESFQHFVKMLPDEQRTKWIAQLTQTIEAALQLDLQTELLANIGPDWGFCVFESTNDQVLPEFLGAVAVRAGSKNVDQAVFRGLDRFIWALVFQHNTSSKQRILLKSIKKQDVEMIVLECKSMFPPGLRPTLALKGGFLLVGSSPSAVERFIPGAEPVASNESPLLRLSFRAVQQWLAKNRQRIADYLAKSNHAAPFVTNQIIGGILDSLSIFNHAAVYQQTGNGTATWRLQLR